MHFHEIYWLHWHFILFGVCFSLLRQQTEGWGNDGHEEGIEGVDLGCGLRRVSPNRFIVAGLF